MNMITEELITLSKEFTRCKKADLFKLIARIESKIVDENKIDQLDPKSLRFLFKVKRGILRFPKSMIGCREYLVIVDSILREEGMQL